MRVPYLLALALIGVTYACNAQTPADDVAAQIRSQGYRCDQPVAAKRDLRRSKPDSAVAEKLAARVAGGLLFFVAAFVIVSSGLSLLGYREPQASFAGIILLIMAAIGMPWLASQKRKLATQVASASLRADATKSALCGYLSLIALAGLLANLSFHAPWADPIAALALVPLITREGWEAIHASRHCCN